MKTRNVGTSKTPASQKRTPPARKSAAKTPASIFTGYSPEPPAEQGKTPVEESATKDTPTATTTKKVTKRIVKKKVIRPNTPAFASAVKADESDEVKAEEVAKDEDTTGEKDLDVPGKEETVMKGAKSAKHEEQDVPKADDDQEAQDKGKAKIDVDELPDIDPDRAARIEQLYRHLDRKLQNVKDEQKPEITDDDQKPQDMEEEGAQPNDDDAPAAEGLEEYGDEEGFVEHGEEDLQEDDEAESVDESYNPPKTCKVRSLEMEEVKALEAERRGTKRRRQGKSNVIDSKSSGVSGSSSRGGGISAPPTMVMPPLKQSGGTKKPSGSSTHDPIWSGHISVGMQRKYEDIQVFAFGNPDTTSTVSKLPGWLFYKPVSRSEFPSLKKEAFYILHPSESVRSFPDYRALIEYMEEHEVVLRCGLGIGTMWISTSKWEEAEQGKSYLWGSFVPKLV